MTILNMDDPLSYLDLSVRLYNCLTRAGITTIGQFLTYPDYKRSSIRNIGSSLSEYESMLRSLLNGSNPDYQLSHFGDIPQSPVSEFHMWICENNYFCRAKLDLSDDDSKTFYPYSLHRHDKAATLIFWKSHGYNEPSHYPVMIRYSLDGIIDFENITPSIAKRYQLNPLSECVRTYIIHNNSHYPVKVKGFDPIPPNSILRFNEEDYCGNHIDGASIIGHGTVISAPVDTIYARFLEKCGTIEKIDDYSWNFYVDKGTGSFDSNCFSLDFVSNYQLNGNLLTLTKDSVLNTPWTIRILLDNFRAF